MGKKCTQKQRKTASAWIKYQHEAIFILVEMRGVEPLRIVNITGILQGRVQIRVHLFFVLQKKSQKPIDITPIECYNKAIR